MSPADESGPTDPTDRSPYDLARARYGTIPFPPARKARWCAVIAFLGALAAPLVATLPPAVRASVFAADPVDTPLAAAALLLFGAGCSGAAGVGFAALRHRVIRLANPVDDSWDLVAAEDVLGGVGLVTGGLGVATGIALLASGHGGTAAVDALRASGVEPYRTGLALAATPRLASVVSLGAGTAAYGANALVGDD